VVIELGLLMTGTVFSNGAGAPTSTTPRLKKQTEGSTVKQSEYVRGARAGNVWDY
jgi:hypothetical protein